MVVDIPVLLAKDLAKSASSRLPRTPPQTAIKNAQMLDCSEQIDALEEARVA
jgi:hypothetical protein